MEDSSYNKKFNGLLVKAFCYIESCLELFKKFQTFELEHLRLYQKLDKEIYEIMNLDVHKYFKLHRMKNLVQ